MDVHVSVAARPLESAKKKNNPGHYASRENVTMNAFSRHFHIPAVTC